MTVLNTQLLEQGLFQDIDPLNLLNEWWTEAQSKAQMLEPSAMVLSTVDIHGKVSSRVLLLKKISKEGLIFFTNYNSPKAQDLATHPQASALLYWDTLSRQVRIEGNVTKTSREESVKYWDSRPRQSQISQYISLQSKEVTDRQKLLDLVAQTDQKFKNQTIPCPENWGGYCLQPEKFEFWIGRDNRLHDRFAFLYKDRHWSCSRLYP